jgi:branched-subunit amino acid ABC-type transport system permease component
MILDHHFPRYNVFIIVFGICVALLFWFILERTRWGRLIRAGSLDQEMLGALGVNVKKMFLLVFMVGSWLGGMAGALVSPISAIDPGMDVEVVINAFIVVVIGGLGSFWGTLLGALIVGQVRAFGLLLVPRASLVFIYALMAIVLVIRPWGLLGSKPFNK